MIYALLSRNFAVRIYALFPQIFGNWKVESADFFSFRMYVWPAFARLDISSFPIHPFPSLGSWRQWWWSLVGWIWSAVALLGRSRRRRNRIRRSRRRRSRCSSSSSSCSISRSRRRRRSEGSLVGWRAGRATKGQRRALRLLKRTKLLWF